MATNGDEKTPETIVLKDGEVVVSQETLTKVLGSLGDIELQLEEERAKRAGLEEIMSQSMQTSSDGQQKLREKKNYEPAFRTVRLRKYPIAGNPEDLGIIIGWTSRGAYHKVVQTGMGPREVDFIDVIFLGHEKTPDGKIKAESIALLDLINKSEMVTCKITHTVREEKKDPTGEEIDITTYDPQHGLMATGEKIDGYVGYSDIQYTVQIPNFAEPVVIDAKFCN